MRNRRNGSRGQALIELGIVVALLVVLTLGAVEFGYAFLALHFVTQAGAAGARAASVLQVGNRTACGAITAAYKQKVIDLVNAQAGNVAQNVSTTVDQVPYIDPSALPPCPATDPLPKVQVTVTGSIPHLFGLFGASPTNFTRIETFRDEGV